MKENDGRDTLSYISDKMCYHIIGLREKLEGPSSISSNLNILDMIMSFELLIPAQKKCM